MRIILMATVMALVVVLPLHAAEFLGVTLCTDSMSTSIVLPQDSPLILESVEVGDQGALVILLRSKDVEILNQIDDLMTGFTGSTGVGNEKALQWSGRKITAFAQVLKPRLAALAVSTSDDCQDEPVEAPAPAEPEPDQATPIGIVEGPDVVGIGGAVEPAAAVVPVSVIGVAPESMPDSIKAQDLSDAGIPDFSLEGALRHERFGEDWVDVMGVIVNNTDDAFKLATFDLSLWDDDGRLICVDTISVTILKSGQHRAFRDSIRCPGYASESVARTELQFAGGH